MDMVKFCRLCLDIIYDNDFSLVESYVSQILQDLLMKVNLGISGDPVLCKNCTTILQDFCNFKCKCLSTENIILHFKDTYKNSRLDLSETYLKGNKDDINNILEGQQICRFCMKCIEYEFTQLYDRKENIYIVSMLQKHIPELNLNVAEELIACKSCFYSLQGFHDFITKCTDIEDKITKYAESEGTDVNGHVQLNKVAEFTHNGDAIIERDIYDKCGKEGSNCIKIKSNTLLADDENMSIKTEEINIKMELTDNDSRDTTATSPQCDIPVYKCQKCSFTTKYRRNLPQHNQIHQSPSEVTMYKCDICPYTTRFKYVVKRHSLKHKDPSELEMFSCELCTYKTKVQRDLKRHSLKHKDLSELETFSCELCTYETKLKSTLKRHMEIHQNLKERIHKCNVCFYAAKDKWRLNDHMLVHKSSSEVTMYKCPQCTFETKHKKNLPKHSRIVHERSAEVFKCDSCSYETGMLGYLKQHMIIHKNPSKIKLLECLECSYKTKNKKHFQKHKIVHKDPSELGLYKCENCTYESKNKKNLKRHVNTYCGVEMGP